MIGIGLGMGLSSGMGAAAFDPTTLPSFRSQYLGSALQTDTAGHNNYTVIGAPTHGTQNGLSTTIFNGSTDRLNLAAFSMGTTVGQTIAIACKVISSDATSRQIVVLSDSLNVTILGTSHTHANINDGGVENEGTTVVSGVWKRMIVTNSPGVVTTGQKLYINGALELQQTAGGFVDNIPSQIANYFQFCNVEIGEILFFKADLSLTPTDLANVDNYLSTKWAI